MHTLYSMQNSGNCYKARLAMAQLGIPFKLHDIDVLNGETRKPEFLAKNPAGQVPLLELDDGRLIAQSNAALFYLAEGTTLLSADRFHRAQTLQWMFFEQYSHEPYIAVARYWWHLKPGGRQEKQGSFKDWHARGAQALGVMDGHLSGRDWFAGDAYSIADIALYAYTHVAGEGGFDLAPYRALNSWLDRVAGHPRHVTMAWRPT